MVKAKGRSHQPNTYYMIEASDKRLVRLMEKKENRQITTEEVCNRLYFITNQISLYIEKVKKDLLEFRKIKEK